MIPQLRKQWECCLRTRRKRVVDLAVCSSYNRLGLSHLQGAQLSEVLSLS